jgi:hypothetical protein
MKKIFILAAILVIGGAAYNVPPAWEGANFSHKLHIEDNGLSCTDCHFYEGKPEFANEACANCHDNPLSDEFIKFGKNMAATRVKVGYQHHSEFDHTKHLDRGALCEQCHGKMAEVNTGSPENWPKHKQCWACHDNKQAPANCELCHANIEDRKPANHSNIFKYTHGKLASTVKGNDCTSCHKSADKCAECHRGDNFETASHPHDFIYRHSFDAKRNKANCLECHDDGAFCAECHFSLKVKPESHTTGNFFRIHKDEFMKDANSCALCHSQADAICLRCHNIVKP